MVCFKQQSLQNRIWGRGAGGGKFLKDFKCEIGNPRLERSPGPISECDFLTQPSELTQEHIRQAFLSQDCPPCGKGQDETMGET